jgi:hypothetical protein
MLWSVVCLNGIAGVSVLSTGKDIMMDIFGNAPASVRTPGHPVAPPISQLPRHGGLLIRTWLTVRHS